MKEKVLVLGVGNILLGDEGVGVRIVEELERRFRLPPEVTALDGGTSGMDLLNPISDCQVLIIADAVRTGASPGTVVRLDGDEVPALFRSKLSPHQVGISDVLAAAALTERVPGRIILFGVVPENLDLGLDLSDLIAPLVGTVVGLIADELRSLGHRLEAA
ncbi:MAG: HyaD/HybD family hydrogenase maturation endopeptidase [Magnetospirillum sp. WYHS-4]